MIDSHCHLNFPQFKDIQSKLINEALDAGVHTIINIGVDLESSAASIALAEKYDVIYATVGYHPHDARKVDDIIIEKLKEYASHPKVVAIGEIGLDFYRDKSPRNIQEKVFHKQIELAIDCKLPIVIHTRDAFRETIKIVNEYVSDLEGGVFHCFPGNIDEAYEVFEIGFLISVGGILTFKNSTMAQVAEEVSLNRIIIETDAPYLAPVPFRGKTNQPSYVKYVCEKLAELKNLPFEQVEKITDRNCQKLFKLVETFGD